MEQAYLLKIILEKEKVQILVLLEGKMTPSLQVNNYLVEAQK